MKKEFSLTVGLLVSAGIYAFLVLLGFFQLVYRFHWNSHTLGFWLLVILFLLPTEVILAYVVAKSIKKD